MPIHVPNDLAAACRRTPERAAWLQNLSEAVRELSDRWSLVVGAPFEGDDVSSAWVAPAALPDGTVAVLKLGMPHMEGRDELVGLRFWDGDPTVRLIAAAPEVNAMLLERCDPGTALRARPEPEQDVVISGLLRRIWREPPSGHPFRPLETMLSLWGDEARQALLLNSDAGLVEEGLDLFDDLSRTSDHRVLLATDLHAGNVLRARRRPWLVIDPKPFVGDPAYDATQHLLNCMDRLHADPDGLIRRFADMLEVDAERVRLWTFARLATASAGAENDDRSKSLVLKLAPD